MQGRISFGVPALAVAAFCLIHLSVPAQAQSCGDLQNQINWIYKNNGYCFQTEPARRQYGNEGCIYTEQYRVPMSSAERAELDRLTRLRAQLGCGRY